MKIESTYNRIISVPLSITLRKVAGKFLYLLRKNKIRKNIYENQTYSALFDSKQANFFHYFSQPDKSLIKKYSSIIEKIGAKIFNHEYDILGSGWINVRSGYEAKGIEGCQFNPASPVFIDLDTLLPQLVGKNNIDYSKKVGSLIDKDYILHDWQLDFKSGYRWDSLKWHKELTYGYVKGADIKVAWEFGRMQNLPWLAYYAALEKFQGNLKSYESAAREFHNQILDFIAQNPPGFGVQWFVPMDVGIRAANWLVTFDMFHSLGFRFDKEFLTIFINSIYDHGLHIAANLEWSSGMRANHYFANICGLLFIAAYLPVSKQTSQWLLFALQELLNEIDFQFNS
ncbi:MAG: hypothetical protein QG635_824, partial [Bacteroidota bacterium]|nr:hypothetical protein [Bacteroidota bacterium]